MNLYDCKIGDVVMTGDSYGMSPCVCIKEKSISSNYGFEMVTFLDLTNGNTHESGSLVSSFLDDCHILCRINVQELEKIKKVWGV